MYGNLSLSALLCSSFFSPNNKFLKNSSKNDVVAEIPFA